MNLGIRFKDNTNITCPWIGGGVWVKERDQERFHVFGSASWMKGG